VEAKVVAGEFERDLNYYVVRAREERDVAARSRDHTAALAHVKLAAEYERRAGRLLREAALAEDRNARDDGNRQADG
jgi:hypothetical protein